jgi:hypothetical protein
LADDAQPGETAGFSDKAVADAVSRFELGLHVEPALSWLGRDPVENSIYLINRSDVDERGKCFVVGLGTTCFAHTMATKTRRAGSRCVRVCMAVEVMMTFELSRFWAAQGVGESSQRAHLI